MISPPLIGPIAILDNIGDARLVRAFRVSRRPKWVFGRSCFCRWPIFLDCLLVHDVARVTGIKK